MAIVGGGPAGLTAAQDLAKLGYAVTVYEAAPKAGGMLRYGIPDYRLPQEALDMEIQRIAELGVTILTNTPVTDLEELESRHDALLLSVGAHKSTGMRIEGEDLSGVSSAIDFLRRVNAGERPEWGEVVIVGGRQHRHRRLALRRRLGRAATMSPPLSREMPAYAFEVDEAEAEGSNSRFSPTRCASWGRKVQASSCCV